MIEYHDYNKMDCGEEKASYNMVEVQKAPLVACLTCPLCNNLFREATTISECLHTFCEECIHDRLNDDDMNNCPICNASLGCLPLEKLRADNQLREVRAKLLPITSRKRSMPSSGPSVSAPVRRKERSLSSLGLVSMASLSKPTDIVQRGKLALNKGHPSRNFCIDEGQDENGKREFKNSRCTGDAEKLVQDLASKEIKGLFSEFRKSAKSEKKTSTSSKISRTSTLNASAFPSTLDKGSMFEKRVSHRLRIPVKSSRIPRGWCPQGNISSSETKRSLAGAKHMQTFSQNGINRPLQVANLPPLACLAEVAEADACKSATLAITENSLPLSLVRKPFVKKEPAHEVHYMHLPKIEVQTDSAKSATVGGSSSLRESKKASRTYSQIHRKSSDNTETGIRMKPEAFSKRPVHTGSSSFSLALPNEKTGIWFALKAAENQTEDGALPQISMPYIRIKDGKLPVSLIKKYLAKKLDLGSEIEVEIKCAGQPVVSSLPLESVQNIWLATLTAAEPTFLKDGCSARERFKASNHDSLQNVLMVLTYGKNHRTLR